MEEKSDRQLQNDTTNLELLTLVTVVSGLRFRLVFNSLFFAFLNISIISPHSFSVHFMSYKAIPRLYVKKKPREKLFNLPNKHVVTLHSGIGKFN